MSRHVKTILEVPDWTDGMKWKNEVIVGSQDDSPVLKNRGLIIPSYPILDVSIPSRAGFPWYAEARC